MTFVVDMRIAASSGIFVPGAGVYPALTGVITFTTDDPTGEAVSILVFAAALIDAFFSGSMLNQGTNCIEVIPDDDCFMVI